MPVALQVVLGVVIAILIALVLFRRRPKQAAARPPVPPPAGELGDRLRTLLAQGKKIQAIKELREHTPMGLAEAKHYVENLPAAGPLLAPPPPPELSPSALLRARALVAEGKYVHAVKVIREDTGWPLKKAKDAMDRLRAGS